MNNGVRASTPFLLVSIVLATTDVVYAIESSPTVFGITDDPFIVWTSNAMAVLGMRPLFFLLVGMVKLFRYLQYGLAAILGFVGLKMIVETAFEDFHVISKLGDIYLALGIIVGILVGSVLLSMILPNDDADNEDDEDQGESHYKPYAVTTAEPDDYRWSRHQDRGLIRQRAIQKPRCAQPSAVKSASTRLRDISTRPTHLSTRWSRWESSSHVMPQTCRQ